MGYLFYSFQDQCYCGENLNITADNVKTPYNFISSDDQSLYKSNIPFSMSMMTMNPGLPKPYQFTVISPGYYMYIDLNQNEYTQQVSNRGLHQHNTIEILYTREGEFYQQIEAKRYKYGARSCCLLNRNVRHREEFASSFSIVTLSVSYAFLRELYEDPLDRFFQMNAPSWKAYPDLKPFFSSELPESDSEKKSFLNFTPTPDTLDGNDDVHDIYDQLAHLIISPSVGSSHTFRALVCRLLTLLCDTSRYFFSMQQAARLLCTTGKNVSQIASELGFTDRIHFYELFRQEFGMTPKEYRKSRKN